MSLEIANLKDYVLGLNNGLSSSVGERGVQYLEDRYKGLRLQELYLETRRFNT